MHINEKYVCLSISVSVCVCAVTYPELFWADEYIPGPMKAPPWLDASIKTFKVCASRCSKNARPGPGYS